MSTTPPEPPPRASTPPPAPEFDIPNAEKYMLEADVMRRRQLRSALLHGSTRTWREHRKVWPSVVAGIVAVGLIIAIIAVKSAYDKDKQNQQDEELAAFCDTSTDEETALLGDFTLNEPDDVESVAGVARDLHGAVPDHVADEIEDDLDTMAEQYELMVEAVGDEELLEELNAAPKLEDARRSLQDFNDEFCE